jgi:hypothetical protein
MMAVDRRNMEVNHMYILSMLCMGKELTVQICFTE